MVDALDSKSSVARHESSSLSLGTEKAEHVLFGFYNVFEILY